MDEVTARHGKVLIPGGVCRDEGQLVEEYSPEAARLHAAAIYQAAEQAERQAMRIAAACLSGHDWDDGIALWAGDKPQTRYTCLREGCGQLRYENGHRVDPDGDLARLREELAAAGDTFGLDLLNFARYPTLIVLGAPLSREQRLDAAGLRAAMRRKFTDFMALLGGDPP